MTTNPRTIIAEVGEWAKAQPWGESSGNPKHAPDFGIIEEFGELMHAVLKNYQGIRGFDDIMKFNAAVTDACGDMMVYLSHWCYLNKGYYTFANYTNVTPTQHNVRPSVVQVLIRLTQIVSSSNASIPSDTATHIAINFTQSLQQLCFELGFNLHTDCLVPTWEKVKQRNWNKDKAKGGESAVNVQHKHTWVVMPGDGRYSVCSDPDCKAEKLNP